MRVYLDRITETTTTKKPTKITPKSEIKMICFALLDMKKMTAKDVPLNGRPFGLRDFLFGSHVDSDTFCCAFYMYTFFMLYTTIYDTMFYMYTASR